MEKVNFGLSFLLFLRLRHKKVLITELLAKVIDPEQNVFFNSNCIFVPVENTRKNANR